MSSLTQEQLRLLDRINKTRLALSAHFKASSPSPSAFMKELMMLEVLLMENKNKEDLNKFISENQANLDVLINHLIVKEPEEAKGKKFNIKWRPEQQRVKTEQPKQEMKSFVTQKPYKSNPFNNAFQHLDNSHSVKENTRKPQVPLMAKAVIPAGEFMSANSLPKGTSVRKKFVPPYKKPQAPLKQLDEKGEEDEQSKDPTFKHLEEKLVSIILSDILEKGETVKWSQIAGLGFAKKIIHEMIVWPMLRPDIFTGMRAPPRAILLFGPPGTGKTMIGKAIASEASATFFSISASSLTSKWVGESEKLVKTLFAIARIKQPSVIFIDQIDSLLSSRSEGEQESSRRVKTEFLIELDGAKTSNNERVLIIGATNLPKELDDAVRRRFVKRLYIPLPNTEGRVQLVKSLTSNAAFHLTEDDIRALAIKTKGFSGADLYNLCSEASMIPLREMSSIQNVRQSEVPQSELRHFEQAFKLVRPSVNRKLLKSFEQFNEQYGSYQLTPDELETDEQPYHYSKE